MRKLKLLPHMSERFRCPRFSTKMSRSSCAQSFGALKIRPRVGNEAIKADAHARCRGCSIGAAHASGLVPPEAPAVELVPAVDLSKPRERPKCFCGCGLPVAPGRRYYATPACAHTAGRGLERVRRAAGMGW